MRKPLRKACKTVLMWSVASFGLTTAFFLPGSLQADGPSQVSPGVAMPTSISTDHFDLSLRLSDRDNTPSNPIVSIPINPGPAPKMKLSATNKTGAMLTIPVKVVLSASPAASKMSRVMPIPVEIGKYDREITLQPGATDSVEISFDAKLAAGSNGYVAMTAGEKTVCPLLFAVKAK